MEETLEELDYELGDSPAEVRDRLTNALDEGMGRVNLYTVPDSMGTGTATAGDGQPVDPQLFDNGTPNLTSSTNINLDSALAANPSHQSPATPGLSGGEPQSNLGTRTDDAVVPTPQQGILLEMLQRIVNCEVAAATQGQFISTLHQPPHPEALKNHPTLAKFKQMLDERIKAEDLPTYQKVQVEFSRLADAGESEGAVVDKCVVLFSQHMDEGRELALAEVQYAFFQLLQADGGLLGGGANAHLIFNKFVRAEASRTVLQYQDRFHDAVKMGARWQFSPFRKFRDLPPETRLMIWGYALGLDVPRIVRWGRDSCPAAAVLQACKEAFELWAKDYSIWRIKDNERIKVHFKDMDTYYFGDSIPILRRLYYDNRGPVPERMNLTNPSQVEWPHAFGQFTDTPMPPPANTSSWFMLNVTRIAIPIHLAFNCFKSYGGYQTSTNWKELSTNFGGLTSLVLVSNTNPVISPTAKGPGPRTTVAEMITIKKNDLKDTVLNREQYWADSIEEGLQLNIHEGNTRAITLSYARFI